MSTTTTITPEQAAAFRALGHPVRMDILATLAHRDEPLSPNGFRDLKIDAVREASPKLTREQAGHVVDAQGYTLGAVAYHFRRLSLGSKRSPGKLILLARETRVRGAVEHHYRIGAAGQRVIAPMVGTVAA